MEKAILKTLIYSDIFEFPLTLYEIHKWLIGKKVDLRQVEKALKDLNQKSKVKSQKGFFFLKNRSGIVEKRLRRQKQSLIYIRKASFISKILKVIPWIKLIGISGGLAMANTGKKDDIDLILITSKNRLWISRLLVLIVLSLLGQRRRVDHTQRQAAGKICCNLLMDENNLSQKRKDIYTAHEVLQMKVLWQRDGIYQKYLSENSWVFKYLPNWIGEK